MLFCWVKSGFRNYHRQLRMNFADALDFLVDDFRESLHGFCFDAGNHVVDAPEVVGGFYAVKFLKFPNYLGFGADFCVQENVGCWHPRSS